MKVIEHVADAKGMTIRLASFLGVLGLIPFAAGAIAAWARPPLANDPGGIALAAGLLLYGAVILSFMAGARWGAAIQAGRQSKLISAVSISLLGWAAILPNAFFGPVELGLMARCAVLLTGFIVLIFQELLFDEHSPGYRGLRKMLTLCASIFLLFVMAGYFWADRNADLAAFF